MSLYKVMSGLVFDDNFNSLDERWTLSPQSSFRHSPGTLRVQHSDTQALALFNLPEHESSLLFEVTADYVPAVTGDEGGLVVWRSSISRLEFLESLDTKVDEYTMWRALKKGNLWTFFARRNGSWELFDSAFLDANRIGITLKGDINIGYVPLDIKRAVLCRGDKVGVGNLREGYRVYLKDISGQIVDDRTVQPENTGLELQLPVVPFQGSLLVEKTDGDTDSINDVTFYGGDTYILGSEIVVEWNGVELSTSKFTNLGVMKFNTIERKMSVVNKDIFTALDVSLSIKQYREEFGWEWVDVALDEGGVPGQYSDVIQIGSLDPGEHREFWVKLMRQDGRFQFTPTHFIMDVRHS